uniref:POU domain protein n=1 Tax=Parastrongyloides trichosuri TaxID=131310 RepID=A0A0N4ZWE7_PARTI
MQSSNLDALSQDSLHSSDLIRSVLQMSNNSIPTLANQNVSPFLPTMNTSTTGTNNIPNSMGLLPMMNGSPNNFSTNNYLYNSPQLSLESILNIILSNPMVFGNAPLSSPHILNLLMMNSLGNSQTTVSPVPNKNTPFLPTSMAMGIQSQQHQPINIPSHQQHPPTSLYDRIPTFSSTDNLSSSTSFQAAGNQLFASSTPSNSVGTTVNSNLYLQHLANFLSANQSQNKLSNGGVVYNSPSSDIINSSMLGSAFNENKQLLQENRNSNKKISKQLTTTPSSPPEKVLSNIKNSECTRKRKISSSSTGLIEQMSTGDVIIDGEIHKQTSCTNSGRSSIELYERRRAFSDMPLVAKKKNIGSKASENSPKRHHPDNLIPSDGKARLVESLAAMCLLNGEGSRIWNAETFASIWNDEENKEDVNKNTTNKGEIKIDESGYTSADSSYSTNCGVKAIEGSELKFNPMVTVNSRSITPDVLKDVIVEEKEIKEENVVEEEIHSPSSEGGSSISSSSDNSIKSSSPILASNTPVSKEVFNDMLDGILTNLLTN